MNACSFSAEHDALRRQYRRALAGNRKRAEAARKELVHYVAHLLQSGEQLKLPLTESEPCQ